MQLNFDVYRAHGQGNLPPIEVNDILHDPKLYIPAEGLVSAVNIAIMLGQPLLLTGEPGTGKTELAHHIAYFFGLGEPLIFNAQTTSVAKDLFYRYDALGHFQYSQTQSKLLNADEVEKLFIQYHALGEAIIKKTRTVVLIDEIDKAPRDLPNDMLNALEKLRFSVPEAGKEFSAPKGNRPIIILTSNSEKNLPDAFLRRVVYYHINFPDQETLLRIVSSKVAGFKEEDILKLISHFEGIRKQKLRKTPATSELLQWCSLLHRIGFPAEKIDVIESLSEMEKDILAKSYSVLAKSKDDLKILTGNL